MKVFLFLLVLILLVSAVQPTHATVVCEGVVISAPVGLGLPVMEQPAWDRGDTGRALLVGDHVWVASTHYRLAVGDIWYQLEDGWVQAYSGYTTGFSQVILGDFFCGQALVHTVGD